MAIRKKISMRITKLHRYMAIARHPNYIKDYMEYNAGREIINKVDKDPFSYFISPTKNLADIDKDINRKRLERYTEARTGNLKENIKSKWGIDDLIAPYSTYEDVLKNMGEAVYEKAVEIVDEITEDQCFQLVPKKMNISTSGSQKKKMFNDEDDLHDELQNMLVIPEPGSKMKHNMDKIIKLIPELAAIKKTKFQAEGRYIYLKIDLFQEEAREFADFIIRYCQEFLPDVPQSKRWHKYDPFEIWDMVHKQKRRNLRAIAMETLGIDKDKMKKERAIDKAKLDKPTYEMKYQDQNARINTRWQQIKHSDAAAKKMIDFVGEEALLKKKSSPKKT